MSPRLIIACRVLAIIGLALLSPLGAELAQAQATSFDLYGFRSNEGGGGALSTEWTKGNLGNTWSEGEWVPYKLTITNVQNSYPNLVGFINDEIEVSYDFTSQGNRFVDLVRGLQVSETDLSDAQGWVQPDGSPFSMGTRPEIEVAQNGQMENTWTGFSLLRTASATFAANLESNINRDLDGNDGTPTDERHTFTIPIVSLIESGINPLADTIIIYWQLHESRSFVWFNSLQDQYDAPPAEFWGGFLYSEPAYAADARQGAGFVPGSSGHIHLEEVSGSKDVPIPIPERLPGAVSGLKWHDINGDGLINGSDTTLAGWDIFVSGTLEQIVFTTMTTTDALGNYSFPNLTSNVLWRITEASQLAGDDGWMQTYPEPGDTVGVGTGTDFSFGGDTADYGWSVALSLLVEDQPDMNFGNRLCDLAIICPADDTLECNTSTDPSVTGYPTIIGNCGPFDTVFSDNVLQGACGIDGFVEQIERTWIVTDGVGNADTCVQIITAEDTTPPILPSPPADQTLECDANLAPPNLAPPTDNCDPDPTMFVRQDTIPGACPQSFTIVNTWRAVDACGNSDSVKQTITVVDSTPPVLSGVPGDATYECAAPAAPAVTATDNCDEDVAVILVENTTGSCPATLTRVWTATDDCGNSVADTQVVTIVDNTNPVLAGAPGDVSQECSDAYPDTATVTATDNCDPNPNVSFGETVTPGACADEYTIRRVWTATDSCGNQDSAVQTITVQDTTPPVISCPSDRTFECDDVGGFGFPTATDNCTADPTITKIGHDSTAGNCAAEYTLVLTYEAMDDCGNADTCSQTITVEDTTPPVIACPSDRTFECDNVGDFGFPTATDNCDPDVAISEIGRDSTAGNCAAEYTLVLTYEAIDDCGNADRCSQTITVQDTTPPVIVCPADVNANCDDIPGFGEATATDNCSDPSIRFVDDTLTTTCPLEISRTWIAEDPCGNADSCVQSIIIDDTSPPVIACPSDRTFECDNVGDFGFPTATDNCGDPNIFLLSRDSTAGNCASEYTLVLTYRAVDGCGNADTCAQIITVQDTTPPVITCPSDRTFECDNVGDFGSATAEDNCTADPAITQIGRDSTAGDCAAEYTLVLTYEAMDDCGNADTCSQTITVEDTTPPVIACPEDKRFECDAVGDFGTPTATDNCDADVAISEIARDSTPGNCPQDYVLVLSYEAMDNCGNADTCSQTITVEDTTPPVITCPANINAMCDDIPDFGSATATDNCDPDPSIRSIDDTLTTTCPLEIARTWIATDACGNADSCVQTIIVDDDTPPVIACPSDRTFECDAVGDFGTPTASDNCTADPTINLLSRDSTAGSCAAAYTIVLTYEAVDNCGNADTCAQTVTVEDTTPPVLACPSDRSFECDNVGDFGSPTATDNCDADPSITMIDRDSTATCPQGYVLVLTYEAMDDCGNADTCSQTVTVDDTVAPTLTCAADSTVDCDQAVIFTPPSVSDNCDPSPAVNVVSTDTIPGPALGEFTHTRTWIATDACGNNSFTCDQSIIVLPCPDSGCTFTQGGWGSKCPPGHQGNPLSTQPGCIRDNFFAEVFPAGVTIGDPSGYTATWTSSVAVKDYLPAGGTPRPLSQNYTDPTSTSAGVLGGQVLALTLNVAYSCAGVFNTLEIADPGFCYASYIVPEFCGKFGGIRVDSFLVLANLVLSGNAGAVEGYEARWSDVNYTATCLNELLDGCDPTSSGVSLLDLASAGLILGDVDYSGHLSSADLILLANYILQDGPPPIPVVEVGDVDWNGDLSTTDLIYLADWILKQPILTKSLDLDKPEDD